MTTSKNIRRLRSGSAMVYMSVLIVAITTVVVSTAELNRTSSQKAERQIDAVLTDESESGVVAAVQAKCNVNSIALPQVWNFSLNGQTQSVTVTDNSALMDRTYSVATTVSGKTTRTFSRVVAGRQTSNPFYYALWLNNSTDLSARRVITTDNGHVYCRGNLTLRSTSSIEGEVIATGSITTNGANITRNVIPQARNRSLVNPPASDYDAATVVKLNSDITSVTFLPVVLGAPYQLRYYNATVKFSGPVVGKGTIYFQNNVRVDGNITYSNAAARGVFIVDGNLRVNGPVTRMDGTWFVKGNVEFDPSGTTLDMLRGGLIVGGNLTLNRDLTIGGDTSFWSSRDEGTRHRLPGFWPTATAGLLR